MLAPSEVQDLYSAEWNASLPIQIVGSGVKSIYAWGSRAHFIKEDNSLWAIGLNSNGQLGIGNTTAQYSPVQVLTTYKMQPKDLTINVGTGGTATGQATFDLNATATLVATPSNGYVFAGWVGDLSSSDANTTLVMSANYEVNATFSPDTGDDDGDGLTNYEEWVTYSTDANNSDSDDDGLTDGVEVNGGTDPNLADSDYDGVSDLQESIDQTDPLDGNSMLHLAVEGGENHTLIIKTDGSLWAVGENGQGQLGDGTTTDRSSPVKIVDANVTQIACGYQYSLFLKSNGSLWAMGLNTYGQLGDGTTDSRSTPVQIVSSGVALIDSLYENSAFVKTDGSLWTMGRNQYGQIGDGTTNDHHLPYQVLPSGVSEVSVGRYHMMYLKTDGSLWGFGRNNLGQLGDGSTTDRASPTQIRSSGISKISVGENHSHFID